jgi:hypothetical protein
MGSVGVVAFNFLFCVLDSDKNRDNESLAQVPCVGTMMLFASTITVFAHLGA